jgi:hypothetical protein
VNWNAEKMNETAAGNKCVWWTKYDVPMSYDENNNPISIVPDEILNEIDNDSNRIETLRNEYKQAIRIFGRFFT